TVTVAKRYLSPEDKVLIIDDFLAKGEASRGMVEICRQAGAEIAGIGICIEKGFQPGGEQLREAGYHLESLAIIDEMDDQGTIRFRKQ
ncbi:MAG: xanthine phosphoribosyltransferase, partial [Erysipelotrichaceae bacterium]|nr:xanthine phosphoribosyltransferase [Erysipelotrichaceae bacterium]